MNDQPENKIDAYAQHLLDGVVSLRHEVDNLSHAYVIVNERFNKLSSHTHLATIASLKEAINAEELARLCLVSCKIAHNAALVLDDPVLIEVTSNSVSKAETAYTTSQASSYANVARQAGES